MQLATQLGWVLLAVLTIYWNGTVVLSLPPSLIANAASLRQRIQLHSPKGQHTDLPKRDDAGELIAPTSIQSAVEPTLTSAPVDHAPNSLDLNGLWPKNSFTPPYAEYMYEKFNDNNKKKAARQRTHQFENEYDLNALLSATNDRDNAMAAPSASSIDSDIDDAVRSISGISKGNDGGVIDVIVEDNQPIDLMLQETLDSPQNHHDVPLTAGNSLTPLKYWARQCQLNNKNCLQEYYSALFRQTDSNKPSHSNKSPKYAEYSKVLPAAEYNQIKPNFFENHFDDYIVDGNLNIEDESDEDESEFDADIDDDDDEDDDDEEFNYNASPVNDIFMLINGEQEVIKFLHWAMQTLYPLQQFENVSRTSADKYYPGMFIWKKLNSSGRLEPPLLVEEPHYIIVRREKLDSNYADDKYDDDPFIPPRGRKQEKHNLESLLQRSDSFIPNRGRRDKIKDIFKYDDLFFPNRGKKMLETSIGTALLTKPTSPMLQMLKKLMRDDVAATKEIKHKIYGYNQSVKPWRKPIDEIALKNLQSLTLTRPMQKVDNGHNNNNQHNGKNKHNSDIRLLNNKQWILSGGRSKRGTSVTGASRMAMANRFHRVKSKSAGGQHRHHKYQQQQQQQQQLQQQQWHQDQQLMPNRQYQTIKRRSEQRANQQQQEQQQRQQEQAAFWRHLQLLHETSAPYHVQESQRERQLDHQHERYYQQSPETQLAANIDDLNSNRSDDNNSSKSSSNNNNSVEDDNDYDDDMNRNQYNWNI